MPEASITKRTLAASLKALMEGKPFEKVSIGEICDCCGMNRRSFYYHFQDKYELAIWIYETEFLGLVAQRDYDTSWAFLLDLCAYFHDNRAFYINLLAVSGQNSFKEYYAAFLTPMVVSLLEPEFEDSQHAAFFAEFFADALIISLEKWLRSGAMGADEYVRLLRVGVEGTAKRVLSETRDRLPGPPGAGASPAE